MKDCRDCGKPVDGLTCPYCGYSEIPEEKPVGINLERSTVDRYRCSWTASTGERCSNVGSMSTSTKGEGPFFCRPHFGCSDVKEGDWIVEKSQPTAASFDPVGEARRRYLESAERMPGAGPADARELVQAFAQKLRDGPANPREWAYRIIERFEAGEKVNDYALACAREAVM